MSESTLPRIDRRSAMKWMLAAARISQLVEPLAEGFRGLSLDPGKSLQHQLPIRRMRQIGRTDPFVDKVMGANRRGARRDFIGRNDDIAKGRGQSPLLGSKGERPEISRMIRLHQIGIEPITTDGGARCPQRA